MRADLNDANLQIGNHWTLTTNICGSVINVGLQLGLGLIIWLGLGLVLWLGISVRVGVTVSNSNSNYGGLM